MTEIEWIESIPKFESSDGRILSFSSDFVKEKLYNALINKNIICLARGEGRSRVLNDIVFHPEILFDWGEKSIHAFLEKKQERFRNFFDPSVVDKDEIIYFIRLYATKLMYFNKRYTYLKCDEGDIKCFLDRLIAEVSNEYDSTKLLCIKDWLIYALHTMGIREFNNITPCISCSCGDNRFNTARMFGKGRYNNYYVIMDSWVNIKEEGIAYKRTDYVNEVLEQYGLRWFPNRHNEIMLKFGIFPQQLVGYYLVERNFVQKYVINRHYVDKWEENPEFEIGDQIYFEQIIDFEKLGPYNTVYEYNGESFSVAGRRN